ncbi:hypothetical protein DLE60_21705 [Micromonospora globispora]|uniref:DUF3618 domain-containing protein n=1 Tax=Micromonospora globispora TaxID=1450148 RepID=A0A317JRA6_9ACTN|nr:DUF3618 domain-containing protein [Micromonospora globispora]PWU43316.1 hypothetical protein DLJ46_32010 [Micromonospora globispora]PWU58449.1 hypothetical protein DLE60_21705 [Micromonospora globispora]RQX04444.1 hypothetical protein DKL51_03345 [Micromonospora globispora]
MTGNGTGDTEALREEIRRTRVELGETMELLAAKADVKARLRESAEQAKGRMREQAALTMARVRGQAAQKAGEVRGQAAQKAGEMRGQAAQKARVARVQAYEKGDALRRNPAPWAAVAAGALATVVVLLIVRGRRR